MTATTAAAFLQCKRHGDSKLDAQLQVQPAEPRQVPVPVEPQPQELEAPLPVAHGTVTVMTGSTPAERHRVRVGGTSGSAQAEAVIPVHALPIEPQPQAKAASEVAPAVMVSPTSNRPPLPLSEPIQGHHELDLCAALRLMLNEDAGLAGDSPSDAAQRHSWEAARTCTPGGLSSRCEGKLITMFVQPANRSCVTQHHGLCEGALAAT